MYTMIIQHINNRGGMCERGMSGKWELCGIYSILCKHKFVLDINTLLLRICNKNKPFDKLTSGI